MSTAVLNTRARRSGFNWLVPLLVGLSAGILYTVNLERLPAADELHHVLAARGLLETGEPRIAEGLYNRALLHTWFVAESFRLFGESLAAARFPSVLCSAALVALLFAWLRSEAGTAAAWLGALLFALSPMAIDVAQFARFYAPQCLTFFVAALLVYQALAVSTSLRWRLLLVAAALPCLLLAAHFQETTLIGALGLAIWGASVLSIPWLSDASVPRRRKMTIVGALWVLGLVVLAGLIATGLLEELWRRYRWTPLFDRSTSNEFWFYHAHYNLLYPSLWPLTGILGAAGIAAAPSATIFALVIFFVGFLTNSFGGPKSLHYIAYAHPFLFIIWGIGLAKLWPWLTRLATDVTDLLTVTLAPGGRRVARLLVTGAVAFLLLANPAWVASAALLANIPAPSQRPKPDWPRAKASLLPWVNRADVVVTTEELGALYFLGRYDIRLSRSKLEELPKEEEHDFGRDPRTGRPVIGSVEALKRILACYRVGVILGPLDSWSKPHVISPEAARVITDNSKPLPLPPQSRVYAYVWEHMSPPPANVNCVDLPSFPKPE